MKLKNPWQYELDMNKITSEFSSVNSNAALLYKLPWESPAYSCFFRWSAIFSSCWAGSKTMVY